MAIILGAGVVFWPACEEGPGQTPDHPQAAGDRLEPNHPASGPWPRPRSPERLGDRRAMVQVLRDGYELSDRRILRAMEDVPRHWFVPRDWQDLAYADRPLPIGQDQTISQPYIVAYMTGLLAVDPNDRVLEIGTGSGYQAAVLNEFTRHVYSIEINRHLAAAAQERFDRYGYRAIRACQGDGYLGWPRFAPFDAIIVTCAPDHIPQPLIDQLRPGGRMCIPVGGRDQIQYLLLVTKQPDGRLVQRPYLPVRFVPLIREK
ncbi:MAG: protein-L-isoaspartate(D-aspartate) O-methyltransferase [Sedimentisphaerales bacterium]|nr:protein-L-isoaspartate(D-aspartate) O-methyltransferase [Sedimentisphaerales bacterium]